MILLPDAARALLTAARQAIRAAVLHDPPPTIPSDPALQQRAGCFVSLHDMYSHRLRGCVGRMESDLPLAQLVPEVAKSCLHDPRFADLRITADDLPELEIEITVLSPLREAAGTLDFDLGNDGILLEIDQRSGCFLPQVARETRWGREQLLSRLCVEKLELPANAWRWPQAKLRKFTTLIIGPQPFDQA